MAHCIILLTMVALSINANAKRVVEHEVLAVDRSSSNGTKGSPVGLPPFLVSALEGQTSHECVFNLADAYTKKLEEEDKQKIWNEAWEEASKKHTILQSGDLRIEEDMGIDEEMFPLCKSSRTAKQASDNETSTSDGAKLQDCGASLPPTMWLMQRLANKDLLQAHNAGFFATWKAKYEPTVKAREHVFDLAMKKTGFSRTRTDAYCRTQESSPDLEELRACILSSGLLNDTAQTKVKSMWELDDEKLVLSTLTRKDKKKEVADRTKELTDLISKVRQEVDESIVLATLRLDGMTRKALLKSAKLSAVSEKGSKTIKACTEVSSPKEKMRVMKARLTELTSVCEEGKKEGKKYCKERTAAGETKYCPTGYACDCQRPDTPDRVKKAMALGFGKNIIRKGVTPDGDPVTAAYFLFSRQFFPKCMCFALKAKWESGRCELAPSSTKMKSSSNPYAWLPADGFKVVPAGSSATTCEIIPCNAADAGHKNAHSLFGKVGRFDKDVGVYNCASTEGTVESSLGRLLKLPMPALKEGEKSPGSIANTIESRNELLSAFSPKDHT